MSEYIDKLDHLIASKHMLSHPFYVAWTKGELSRECLQEYAREYYHHVKAFPTYLSALHSHIDHEEKRKVVLKNLIDEEGGSPNHPDLWREFGEGLGVGAKEWSEHIPCKEMKDLISIFKIHAQDLDETVGLASLYAYESQIPSICDSKINGLRRFYDAKSDRYFQVHLEADKEHAEEERKLIASTLNEKNFSQVMRAVDEVLSSLWNFLNSLCRRYNISMCCHC